MFSREEMADSLIWQQPTPVFPLHLSKLVSVMVGAK